jgi:hypothetical protein
MILFESALRLRPRVQELVFGARAATGPCVVVTYVSSPFDVGDAAACRRPDRAEAVCVRAPLVLDIVCLDRRLPCCVTY